MAGDTGDRMKIVIGYAVWATLCAAAAGVAISLIHTWFFSYHGSRPARRAAATRAPGRGAGADDAEADRGRLRPRADQPDPRACRRRFAARAPVPTPGTAPLLAPSRHGPRPRAMVRPARPVVRRR